MQALVIDAEMVGHFVDDGDGDLLHHVLFGFADLKQALPEDRHRVRQCAGIAGIPFCQRDALLETKQFRILRMTIGDQPDHVPDVMVNSSTHTPPSG